jgi:hypothetical protein
MIGEVSPFLPAYFTSLFGLHSLAERCASAIMAGVIFRSTISLNISVISRSVFKVVIELIGGG